MEQYSDSSPLIKISPENMRQAAERARAARPMVQPVSVLDHLYRVSSATTPGRFYTV